MLAKAVIPGRSHRLMHQNVQDVALAGGSNGYNYGLVLDGCGSKYRDQTGVYSAHNEAGAYLLGQFVANWLTVNLPAEQCLCTMFDDLYTAAVSFLAEMTARLNFTHPDARRRFMATHLLSTVLGFVVRPQDAAFFWVGDGYLCQNGEVTTLDAGNYPDYLAYALADPIFPPTFQVQMLNRDKIEWLAVASDGWTPELLAEVPSTMDNLALQRWLNVTARQPGYFEDDGAIAIFRPQPMLEPAI